MTSKSWRKQCIHLINYLWTLDDSAPFRVPVDPIQYPDYNRIIKTPMDLNTVRESLSTGMYETPAEFANDMQLIFKNSKTYNTCKKSQIYCMTVRLNNLFDEKFKEIMEEHKAAKKFETTAGKRKITKGPVKTSTDRKLKELEKYDNLVNSKSTRANGRLSSASIDPNQPSTSGYSASTSRTPIKDSRTRRPPIKKRSNDYAYGDDDDETEEEEEEEDEETEEESSEEEVPRRRGMRRREEVPRRRANPVTSKRNLAKKVKQETESETEIDEEDSASETEIDDDPEYPSTSKKRTVGKRKAKGKLSSSNKRQRKSSGDSSVSSSSSTAISEDSASTEVNSYESGSRRTSSRSRKPRGVYSPDFSDGPNRKPRACAKQRPNYSYTDEDFEYIPLGRAATTSSRGRVVKSRWNSNRPLVESR